jgi:hypothetical protein
MPEDRKKLEEKVISLLRKKLRNHPIARRLCDKYGEKPDFIDSIPIRFEPLDVSAKTVNGEIILNSKLLDGEYRDNMRYLIHEFVHCLQQENGMVDGGKEGDYLDDPNEIEAFKAQIDFMEDCYDEKEIQQYLDQLMDHHDVKGRERKRKIRQLV